MKDHSIKAIRADFKAKGVFYTPPELAEFLRSLIPGEPAEVYDPTCGRASLLSAFPAGTAKFGQDIDADAVADAQEHVAGFTGAVGDVLTNPAWEDRRFDAIVANPPFSVKWEPNPQDERFKNAPCVPSAGRADYAFILHCLHMLSDTGTAAILSFPGVLYRGQREGKIRAWLIESGHVAKVIHIPGDTFTDTAIATCCLVLDKAHSDRQAITFIDRENGLERDVPLDEIRANGHNLSVQHYVQPPEPERPPVDQLALEQDARRSALRRLRGELEFSLAIAQMEKIPYANFLDDAQELITEYRHHHAGTTPPIPGLN